MEDLKNIRAEMARNGMGIGSLAEYLGLSTNSTSWKLQGKREFTLTELCKLADKFNVSIDYLAERSANTQTS